jgi:8-oxo-dGTP diphosphatase
LDFRLIPRVRHHQRRVPHLSQRIHVAAGVLAGARGEILVARRFDDAHQGGLWEFPGGKLEIGEDARTGLARELAEEIGISLDSARPLIRVRHDYPDRNVLLDVWRVTGWQGRVHGREGQELRWLSVDSLAALPMPAADVPVVTALRLPDSYLVTPSPGRDTQVFLAALRASIDAGVKLVVLRAKALPANDLLTLCRRAADVCRAGGARLLINADPALLDASGADGVHLDSTRLMAATSRPVPAGVWLAASCHDARELDQAARIGVDFAVLSPVAATPSHPQAPAMGWQRFQRLAGRVNLPVFALGGMGPEQMDAAWEHGGQGIAAVRSLWKGFEDGA